MGLVSGSMRADSVFGPGTPGCTVVPSALKPYAAGLRVTSCDIASTSLLMYGMPDASSSAKRSLGESPVQEPIAAEGIDDDVLGAGARELLDPRGQRVGLRRDVSLPIDGV